MAGGRWARPWQTNCTEGQCSLLPAPLSHNARWLLDAGSRSTRYSKRLPFHFCPATGCMLATACCHVLVKVEIKVPSGGYSASFSVGWRPGTNLTIRRGVSRQALLGSLAESSAVNLKTRQVSLESRDLRMQCSRLGKSWRGGMRLQVGRLRSLSSQCRRSGTRLAALCGGATTVLRRLPAFMRQAQPDMARSLRRLRQGNPASRGMMWSDRKESFRQLSQPAAASRMTLVYLHGGRWRESPSGLTVQRRATAARRLGSCLRNLRVLARDWPCLTWTAR